MVGGKSPFADIIIYMRDITTYTKDMRIYISDIPAYMDDISLYMSDITSTERENTKKVLAQNLGEHFFMLHLQKLFFFLFVLLNKYYPHIRQSSE